ncbi:hypothetical protein GO755_05585 [Spirosoma sp. HMF4905]|uniref:TonB C-terminal domain-containing protein n=1 Tax=Spirosoma arboris TaxID=2682092 RepID=A0A7K1S6V0_9BACT|nr:hypothetical protein [Spirosoma arboris]MVM29495.1 hypothetical protein [Spirosoma arboris]
MLYLRLLILSFITQLAVAQVASPNLSQDPVFTTVLNRRLKFPRQAQWSSSYMRIFAEFTIDDKGRIQDISILNHSVEGAYVGFEPVIIAALKKLPSLNLRYTGNYILPVSFILVDYRQKDKQFIPKNTLYVQDLAGRVVLDEINVYGNNVNSKERILSADGY